MLPHCTEATAHYSTTAPHCNTKFQCYGQPAARRFQPPPPPQPTPQPAKNFHCTSWWRQYGGIFSQNIASREKKMPMQWPAMRAQRWPLQNYLIVIWISPHLVPVPTPLQKILNLRATPLIFCFWCHQGGCQSHHPVYSIDQPKLPRPPVSRGLWWPASRYQLFDFLLAAQSHLMMPLHLASRCTFQLCCHQHLDASCHQLLDDNCLTAVFICCTKPLTNTTTTRL